VTSSRISWPPKESSNNGRGSIACPNPWTAPAAAAEPICTPSTFGNKAGPSLQLQSARSSICGAAVTATGGTMMLPSTLVLQAVDGQAPRSLSPVGRQSQGMSSFSEVSTARDMMAVTPQSPRRPVGACQRTGSAPNGVWRPERGAADVSSMKPRTPSPQVTSVARLHRPRTPPVVSVSVPVEVSSTSTARHRGISAPQGSHVSPVPVSGRMVTEPRAVSPMHAAEPSWIPSSGTPMRCCPVVQPSPQATYVDRQGFCTPPRTGMMAREASLSSIGGKKGAPCSGQHLAVGGVCGSQRRTTSRRSFSIHAPTIATGTSSGDGVMAPENQGQWGSAPAVAGGLLPSSWGLHSNVAPRCGLLPGTQVPCAGTCSPRVPSEPMVHGGQATPQCAPPRREASVPLSALGGLSPGILPATQPQAETLSRPLPTPLLPAPSLLPGAPVSCQVGAKALPLLGPPAPGRQRPAPQWHGPVRGM